MAGRAQGAAAAAALHAQRRAALTACRPATAAASLPLGRYRVQLQVALQLQLRPLCTKEGAMPGAPCLTR